MQIAHAAIAATFAYGKPQESHPSLVVCTVADEPELTAAFERLKQAGVPACAWREEDMGGSMTAIATGPLTGRAARRPLRGFELLRAA